MLVEHADKGPTEEPISSVLAGLCVKPSASSGRIVRIVSSAQEQHQSAASFSVAQAVCHGAVLAVVFTDAVYFGEVYRFGTRQTSKSGDVSIKDWHYPIDLSHLPPNADQISLQLHWVTLAEESHWLENGTVPTIVYGDRCLDPGT